MRPLISLCMPTNGISEWVFPVLESIYAQNIKQKWFEVIVADNGNNRKFRKEMEAYAAGHENLYYYPSGTNEFMSEPDAYRHARGVFIKFLNHRTRLTDGALRYWLRFVKKYESEKPVIYFTNGVLKRKKKVTTVKDFSSFVRELGIYSSWSTGMAFWKEDFDRIPDSERYHELYPHTNILFSRRDAKTYMIDDSILLDEMPSGDRHKGTYNLFYAFAVDYPQILLDLVRDGDLRICDFAHVKKKNRAFVQELYYQYIVKKMPCTYDLSGYKKACGVFYSMAAVRMGVPGLLLKDSARLAKRMSASLLKGV